MELYPEVLISHQSFPELDEKEISSYYFIRKTEEDIYLLLGRYKPLELIDKIIPNTTKRDIFVFSVSLYGYFDEEHISIKITDKGLNHCWDRNMPDFPPEEIAYTMELGYPLFLYAQKLYEFPVCFEGDNYFLSFWHKPTLANYWHFQLFTRDSNGQKLPRQPKSGEKETKSEERKLKRLAVVVFEHLLSEAICSKSEVRKFQCDGIISLSL